VAFGPLGAEEATAATTIPVTCRTNPSVLARALTAATAGHNLEITGTCRGPFVIGSTTADTLALDGKGRAVLRGGSRF